MRMIEQSDFLKSAIAAAGVAGVQDLDVRDGQLLLDGCAFVLVAASEHHRLVALAKSVAAQDDQPPAGDQAPATGQQQTGVQSVDTTAQSAMPPAASASNT